MSSRFLRQYSAIGPLSAMRLSFRKRCVRMSRKPLEASELEDLQLDEDLLSALAFVGTNLTV